MRGFETFCGVLRRSFSRSQQFREIKGFLKNFAGVCGSLREFAGVCGSLREFAKFCGSLRENAHMRYHGASSAPCV